MSVSLKADSRQHICYPFPLPQPQATDFPEMQGDQGVQPASEETHGKEVNSMLKKKTTAIIYAKEFVLISCNAEGKPYHRRPQIW